MKALIEKVEVDPFRERAAVCNVSRRWVEGGNPVGRKPALDDLPFRVTLQIVHAGHGNPILLIHPRGIYGNGLQEKLRHIRPIQAAGRIDAKNRCRGYATARLYRTLKARKPAEILSGSLDH